MYEDLNVDFGAIPALRNDKIKVRASKNGQNYKS